MRIHGDIKVWVDGSKACARLYADGPEGPIIIQASAPLDPIRRHVARMFARRGSNVAGNDAAFKGTVKQLARKRALGRLRRLAPRAFQKGALGPYLASRELDRRKRLRFALEQNGMPIGPKAIGPIPSAPGQGRRRRRRRRWLRANRLAMVARQKALPATAPPASAMSVARALLAPSASASPGSSAPQGGGRAPASAINDGGSMDDREGQASETEAAPGGRGDGVDEEAETETEAPSDEEASDGDGGDAPDEESASAEEGADVEGEDEGGEDEQIALARRQLRAALRLLDAARRSPRARRRLRQIATLAGEGDPKARKTVKVLALAHKLRRRSQGRPVGKPIGSATKKPVLLPAMPPRTALAPSPQPASGASASQGPKQPEATRWWDVLAAWRRGMG